MSRAPAMVPVASPTGSEDEDDRAIMHPFNDRIRLDWTPARVRAARNQADDGDLEPAADLCHSLFRDPRISGVMATRTLGQISLPLVFDGTAVRPRKFVETLWHRAFPEQQLAALVKWGLTLGVGVGSLQWLEDDAGNAYPRLHVWDPRYLRFRWYDPTEAPEWRIIDAWGQEHIVTPGDGTWVLFTPYGDWLPWQHGLWQALATPWLLKTFSLFDRAKHSEVTGSPAWVGSTKGLSEKQRKKFLKDLRKMARNARIVLPEGCSLELLETKGRTWEIYEANIDWADRETTITIAGQAVTTEGTTGFSEGDIHDRILGSFIRATAKAISTTIREQTLRPWMRFQFGDVEVPTPRWRTEPPEDLQRHAAGLQSLGQAIAGIDDAMQPHGIRIDVRKLVERYEIPTRRLLVRGEEGESVEVSGDSAIPVQLAPTDIAAVIRVNEARSMMGLSPMSRAGDMTITEWKALNASDIARVSDAEKGAPESGERDAA